MQNYTRKTRKTDIVRASIRIRDYRKALQIAKDFQMNVSPKQREVMSRAYDCMAHPEFYEQIGWNPDEVSQAGIDVLMNLFGN